MNFGCCASKRDSIDEDEGRTQLRDKVTIPKVKLDTTWKTSTPAQKDADYTLRGHEDTKISLPQFPRESEMTICYEQPQSVPLPRAEAQQPRPSTSLSMKSHVSQWYSNGRDLATRASSRTSQYTLTRPRKSHSRSRPRISRPMDVRHEEGFDGSEGIQSMLDEAPMPIRRRRSFRPLELSIYLPDNRLSPLPDFLEAEWEEMTGLKMPEQVMLRNRDSRTNSTTSDPATPSYIIPRKAVGSSSRRSSVQSQVSLQSRPPSETPPFILPEPTGRSDPLFSPRSSLRRSRTSGTSTPTGRILSPSRMRAQTAPSRPASLRKTKMDIDDEVRELNTIVEERRADAYRNANLKPSFINRPPISPSSHVPAIAPSRILSVRSETLSDIGSAFSQPFVSKPLPTPPQQRQTKLRLVPITRTFSGPLDSNPITPPSPTPTNSIHRLGAWLKKSLPTTPHSATFSTKSTHTPSKPSSLRSFKLQTSASPFYQCEAQLPMPASSRPSTAGSGTITHTRHTSADTATVTLVSSYPSTPSLSSSSTRSLSPTSELQSTPPTPARVNILKGEGKTRRIPAPLNLAKEKEMQVEVALGSARSVASNRSARSLKPPQSPNYGLLRGMEISARSVESAAARRETLQARRSAGVALPSPGAVGVAF
ncbi:hypothetical protein K458DRAFT_389234 [Lentithecium fluviatile CBS 122367]|uniref:Uncharacterized protein n=1 Tax=Lentithecium fluviatile CBS 122367 TaxID=1168545 RepID=A0A6G1J1D2_9PLEO|nr:hypothetical protein K458DRAFT_389234 [Lentithecium fluviatile CBS 122367]